jgi:hypothetical protein
LSRGMLNWLGEKAAEARRARTGAPSLEPLEPRVLLSADLADVQLVPSNEAAAVDQAIYVDVAQQDPPAQGASLFLTGADVNGQPSEPTCILPVDGATGVSLTPTLESSDFSDPDAGDTHAASRWRVDDDSDYSSLIWDYEDTDSDKTSQAVPVGTLLYNTTYYWRVRYQDSQGAWSEWSAATSFTTTSTASGLSPVFRFYSPVYSTHLYTMDDAERSDLIDNHADLWTYEGIAYCAFADDSQPVAWVVYRFWSESLGQSFCTINESERDKLVDNYSNIWTYQGVAFYVIPEGVEIPGTSPVYRLWSYTQQSHFWTILGCPATIPSQ